MHCVLETQNDRTENCHEFSYCSIQLLKFLQPKVGAKSDMAVSGHFVSPSPNSMKHITRIKRERKEISPAWKGLVIKRIFTLHATLPANNTNENPIFLHFYFIWLGTVRSLGVTSSFLYFITMWKSKMPVTETQHHCSYIRLSKGNLVLKCLTNSRPAFYFIDRQ